MPKRKTKKIPENKQADVNALVQQMLRDPSAGIENLVQLVLRESYLEATEDLRSCLEQMRNRNESKKAVRAYLTALRKFRANVVSAARNRGVDLCRGDKEDLRVLAEVFEQCAHIYSVGDTEYELCIPDRVPVAGLKSLASLDVEIGRWGERLNSIGDDAQLASIDLQNMLQKQQQALQMMSNVSKMFYDTTMALVRKIGG